VVRINAVGAFMPFAEADTVLGDAYGTGFIIDPQGLVVTNAHVVNGGEAFFVYVPGERTARHATVAGISECSDLAVLDMRGSGFPYLEWANTPPSAGQSVYALGYPGGRYKQSHGEVSEAYLNADTPWASVGNVLYHSADIAPGSSGGPLLNDDGQVLAVNFAGRPLDEVFVAIAWEEAQAVVNELAQGVDLDSIGINGEAFLLEDEELFGIWVVSVESGSPAASLGVQPGDILLSLEEMPLGEDGSLGTYCSVLRSHARSDVMQLMLVRLSTEEFLCGQINGQPLANCDDLAATLMEPDVDSESAEESDTGGARSGARAGQQSSNGIYSPAADATVSGVVAVQGIAVHPEFWKWQVDLLLEGTRETYLGSGAYSVPAPADLLLLDTAQYPNGSHVLRLRVVRKDGNYDEFFAPITIRN
jgi:serine protease Do